MGGTLKKLTALFVTLCMILTISSAAMAAESYAVKINGVTLDETAGTVTSALLTVRTSGKYTAYAAVYEDNALVGAVSKTGTFEKGVNVTATFDDALEFDPESQTLKVFVWNSSQRPVAAAYTYDEQTDDDGGEDVTGAFTATFDLDEHVTVNVSATQSFNESAYVTEDASEAYARSSSTGDIDTTGDGQVNFMVIVDDGYEIDTVTVTPVENYKNLKADGDTYRITKITGDITVAITAKEKSEEEEPTAGGGIIHLLGTSINASEATGVTVDGTTATITLAGDYTIDGTLDDGQINITLPSEDDKVTIILSGVSITSATGNAFNATAGKVTLDTDKKENTIKSTAADATAVYSANDLTIKGGGALTAISEGGNGIRSKDDLEIAKCNLSVTAANNGIKGDKSVTVTDKNLSVTVVSGGDGITSDNAPTIKKPSRTGTVTINGGDINITTSTSTKSDGTVKNGDGIQSDTLLTITGGTINIDAAGEALKANFSHLELAGESGYDELADTLALGDGCIVITGGTITAKAGEDGIKAVKNVTISDSADVTVTQSQEGIQVKEIVYGADGTTVTGYVEGTIDITGGTLNITASEDGIQCGTGDITITGGNITVSSKQDGIQAEYTLKITDGTFNITTNGGASASSTDSCKGLKAGELIYITDGTFTLNTCDDAIHTNNTVRVLGGTYNIATGDDGIHGDSYLYVDGDNTDINITKCYEGLEAAKIYINGGTSRISASDDGVNAAGDEPEGDALDITSDTKLSSITLMAGSGGSGGGTPPGGFGGGTGGPNPGGENNSTYGYLEINGGYVYVTTTNGDGLDANGNIVINGGVAIVDGATLGSEDGLDFDNGVVFNGGYVFTMTAGGMDAISGSYSQKYLLYGFTSSGGGFGGGMGNSGSTLSAGNYCITDENGNILCAFSRSKGSIGRITFSSPAVSSSGTYYIKPLTVSGAAAVDALYGTVDADNNYTFTPSAGCTVGSGTSYAMSKY